MNTQTAPAAPAPATPYAKMLTEAVADAHEENGVTLLCLALRVCAEPRVVALLRHASALVRGAPRDGALDAEAEALVPAVVRVVGAASAALFAVEIGSEDEKRLLTALAEVEHFMDGYEDAALLAGEAVWQELTDAMLFPEIGGTWWSSAYADSLAAPC